MSPFNIRAHYQGLPFEFCLNPDTGLLLPDLTLYLTIPPEVASARSDFGTERYETTTMQQKVKEQFVLVHEQVVKRHGHDKWVEISAVGTIEEVEGMVHSELEKVLASAPEPVKHLWV